MVAHFGMQGTWQPKAQIEGEWRSKTQRKLKFSPLVTLMNGYDQ